MDGVTTAHFNSGLLINLCLTTKWTGRAEVPLKARFSQKILILRWHNSRRSTTHENVISHFAPCSVNNNHSSRFWKTSGNN
jgi:hypothetical protein